MGYEKDLRRETVIFKDLTIIENPLGEVILCRTKGNKFCEQMTLSNQQLMDLSVAISKYFGDAQ